MPYQSLPTQNQKKKKYSKSLQNGGQFIIKPTPKQRGGRLGTILTSIGIPLLLKALGGGLHVDGRPGKGLHVDGRGLQVDRRPIRSAQIYLPPKARGGRMLPYSGLPVAGSPPFIGSWDNPMGIGVGAQNKDKNKREGITIRKRQPIQRNSTSRNNSLIKFINKPLSNIDLLN